MLKKLVLIAALAIVLANPSTAGRGGGGSIGKSPRDPHICKIVEDDSDTASFEESCRSRRDQCEELREDCDIDATNGKTYTLSVCKPRWSWFPDDPPCPCRMLIDGAEVSSSDCEEGMECTGKQLNYTSEDGDIYSFRYCRPIPPPPPPICQIQIDDEDWYEDDCPEAAEGERELECVTPPTWLTWWSSCDNEFTDGSNSGSEFTVSRCLPSRDGDRRRRHAGRGPLSWLRDFFPLKQCTCLVKEDGEETFSDACRRGFECEETHTFEVDGTDYEWTFCRPIPM